MVNFFGRRGWGRGSAAGFAFGSFSSWIPRRLDNPLFYGSMVVQRSILALASASPSVRVAASGVVVIFSCSKSYVFVFLLQRLKNFLPVFWWPTSIRVDVVDLLVCIVETHCAFSTLTILGGS
jgi:hypothetical protein